jgi:ABC-type phosphate/phosphonate transport system substrate-binding protein
VTTRIASLPMYDADRAAVGAWWVAISRALLAHGPSDVPPALEWPSDLDAHWRDPRLLLSQTCGYPLITRLLNDVQVVGAFRYTAPGCSGIHYRSELVARFDDATSIEGFRGRTAVVNAFDSHSGCNALRGLVAPFAVDGEFFAEWSVSGSHWKSLIEVRSGRADIAAIDCVSLAGFRRHEPDSLAGLRVIASTAAAPGLPLITAASTTPHDLQSLRHALSAACLDPALADVREALFIDGFEVLPASSWQVIEDVRQASDSTLQKAN